MIKTFKCKETEKLFNDLDVKRFRSISKTARIKLEVLNATVSLINNQWRICFVWKEENVIEVEIVDYHKG